MWFANNGNDWPIDFTTASDGTKLDHAVAHVES